MIIGKYDYRSIQISNQIFNIIITYHFFKLKSLNGF
jgi:hypothetical protein